MPPHTPPPAPRHNHLGQPIGAALPDWTPRPIPARSPIAGLFCRVEPLDVTVHADDLIAAYALDTEGRNWTYLPHGPFESPEAHRAWLANAAQKDHSRFFAIIYLTIGKAVGIAAFLAMQPEIGSIEVGHLAYSPLLQRTPAATEAMYLMMRRAFEALRLSAVRMEVRQPERAIMERNRTPRLHVRGHPPTGPRPEEPHLRQRLAVNHRCQIACSSHSASGLARPRQLRQDGAAAPPPRSIPREVNNAARRRYAGTA